MSNASLKSITQQIAAQQQKLEKIKTKARAKAIREIHAIMRQAGLSFADLEAAAPKTRKPRRQPSSFYKDPSTGSTWSGQGRMPAWLVAYVEAGGNRDDIRHAAPDKPSPRKEGGKVASGTTYRDPASGKTWSGRGRAPSWIVSHEAAGASREDLKVA